MNLGQLEVFVAVVNTGSLKEAASVVGLTHSAVSYSLSKLEAELGVTLLERGRQGVKLTRIGTEILQHARTILNETEILRQKTTRERGLAVGKIRFACVPQVPSRFLTGIIRDFQHTYPEIQVVLFQGSSQEIMDWLDNRIVDVGTVASNEHYPHSVKLVESEIHVLVPVGHRLANADSIHIDDIHAEPLIGSGREINAATTLPHGSHHMHVELRYQVTETATIYAMVAEGMGLSILPGMLVDNDIPGVVAKPLRPRRMMEAHLATNATSPMNQAFLNAARNWTRLHGFL
jgi:DNA-binding transcriptional LysR family regulator